MIISPVVVVAVPVLAMALIILGLVVKPSSKKKAKTSTSLNKELFSTGGVANRLNSDARVQELGSRFASAELDALFRKSKNPWGLTPASYIFIRYIAAGALIVLGIVLGVLIDWILLLIFAAAGGACFFLPKNKYEKAARDRENQWYQLYQYIWVLKHNLSYFDPKKSFVETYRYIEDHTDRFPELVTGLKDFADNWNGQYMNDRLKRDYGDFRIAVSLFDIVLTSQKTGEYPGDELESLRRVIIEKLNFHVQEVLSAVAMKSTMYSSPFLLATVGLIILVPVIMQILSSF